MCENVLFVDVRTPLGVGGQVQYRLKWNTFYIRPIFLLPCNETIISQSQTWGNVRVSLYILNYFCFVFYVAYMRINLKVAACSY